MPLYFYFLAYLGAFGAGLLAAVLNVKYRDIAQIIPFVVQFGYFISPVAYSSERVKDEWWYPIYNLNPVAGAIDGLRWCLLGNFAEFNWQSFIPMLIFVTISVLFSIWFFRKNENSFVDHL
ncbi:MAG: ABC transporter permease [Emticicia sp.]|nr:ABC transporter permease [Emticicia sp.]